MSIPRFSSLLAAAALSFAAGPGSSATFTAVEPGGPVIDLLFNAQITQGWQFVPSSNITVTALGFSDPTKDGLKAAHQVGILRLADGELVASATVTNASTPQGFYRYTAISPVTLSAGTQYQIVGTMPDPDDGEVVANLAGSVFRAVSYQGFGGGGGGAAAPILFGAPTLQIGGNARLSSNFLFEPAPNYQDLWWNPLESGWGINFAHQGDIVFATWFTYGADNQPQWFTILANKTAERVYAGPVSSFTGLPFNTLPYTANANVKTPVGTATISFSEDGRSATFNYTVNGITQTKQIVPQEFAAPVPSCAFGVQPNLALAANFQDLWWVIGGNESGWGINFTHQGNIIFATWFTYAAGGKGRWVSLVAAQTAVPNVYAGLLKTTTGPPFSAEPFDPNAVVRTTAGNATLTIIDGSHARFDYTLDGVTQSKNLERQVFVAPGTACQ